MVDIRCPNTLIGLEVGMSDQHKRETVSAEQMTYSNMLTINALVELLDERGI